MDTRQNFSLQNRLFIGCAESVHKKDVEVFWGPFDLRLAMH